MTIYTQEQISSNKLYSNAMQKINALHEEHGCPKFETKSGWTTTTGNQADPYWVAGDIGDWEGFEAEASNQANDWLNEVYSGLHLMGNGGIREYYTVESWNDFEFAAEEIIDNFHAANAFEVLCSIEFDFSEKWNMARIEQYVETQKENCLNLDINDFHGSRQSLREYIESRFLEDDDVTKFEDDFAESVSVHEVQCLRIDALSDVLSELELTGADDYEDAIEGLEFSHIPGRCSLNNVHLEAYIGIGIDEYVIVRRIDDAAGKTLSGTVDTRTISVEDYDNLPNDPYNGLVRFQAVNNLFAE